MKLHNRHFEYISLQFYFITLHNTAKVSEEHESKSKSRNIIDL